MSHLSGSTELEEEMRKVLSTIGVIIDTMGSLIIYAVIALAVLPGAQGRGIGRRLLEACEGHVRASGGTFVRLNSRMERTEAHGFYEHLGYACPKVQKYFRKRL